VNVRPLRHAAAGLLCAVALLTACSAGPSGSASQSTQPKVPVVASTNVYGSIAAAVGGDHVAVTSIITDPSADPHSYEAAPANAAAVRDAKIVIANGGGYDDFMAKLVSAAGSTPKFIDVSELSGLKPASGGDFNEHVWYSLPTVRKLAATLATELGTADSANASTYTANAQAFNTKLDGVQSKIDAIKAKHNGNKVAVTEPVPGYLVDAAGLVNTTPAAFAKAVETDTDPPAAVLQATLQLFTGPDKVRVLIANSQTEKATTRQVEATATAAGVPIVKVTETLPAGVSDYVGWMGGQVDALSAALDRP
jgi:zinc/manganese transport system substrate-binding protein